MTRLDSLQVCRAVAALLVVLCHFSINSNIFLGHELFHSFFNFGHAGVSFFFVLSGFIICYTHWIDIGSNTSMLKKYIYKRITRIYPSYLPILLVVTLMYLFFGGISKDTHAAITPIMFIKNIFLVSYDHALIVSVAWTLQYEIIFYAFFAFFILNKNIGKALLIIWVSSIVLFNLSLITLESSFLKFALNLYTIQFLMGCAIAYIIKKYNRYVIAPRLILWTGIMGFIGIGIHENYNHASNTTSTLFAVFSSLIILGLAHLETIKPIRCSRFLVFLGGASYAIYLTHNTLLSVLFRMAQHFPLHQIPLLRFYLLTLFILATAVGLACAYYKYFEGPILNFLRQKTKKKIFIVAEEANIPV